MLTRDSYLELVGGQPMMVIPERTLEVLITVLDIVQPGMVLENGCGWSSFRLAQWCAEHDQRLMIYDDDQAWCSKVRALLSGPYWLDDSRAIFDALINRQPWAALIDGTIEGRRVFVIQSYLFAPFGVMLFDDANAEYVQVAISPLRAHTGGALYDLRPVTEGQRNQTTWSALWVGERVQNRDRLIAWLEGQGCA